MIWTFHREGPAGALVRDLQDAARGEPGSPGSASDEEIAGLWRSFRILNFLFGWKTTRTRV